MDSGLRPKKLNPMKTRYEIVSCVVFVDFMGCKNGKDLISKYLI